MKRWAAIAVALAGAVLIGFALFSSQSDEEIIREKLDALAASVRLSEPENPLFRLSRLNDVFEDLLTKDAALTLPELSKSVRGRRKVAELAAQAAQFTSSLDVSLSDVDVEVGNAGASARAIANISVTRRTGQPESPTRSVSFRLTKPDGDWLIDSISVAAPAE